MWINKVINNNKVLKNKKSYYEYRMHKREVILRNC